METYQVFFKYKHGEFWQYDKEYISVPNSSKNSHQEAGRLFVEQNKQKYDNLFVWKIIYV